MKKLASILTLCGLMALLTSCWRRHDRCCPSYACDNASSNGTTAAEPQAAMPAEQAAPEMQAPVMQDRAAMMPAAGDLEDTASPALAEGDEDEFGEDDDWMRPENK